MKRGEIIEVTVEGIDERGDGIARHEDRQVLVPGLFPGERGLVQIEALSRHSAKAHAWLRSLVRPSPARRALPCPRHERHPQDGMGVPTQAKRRSVLAGLPEGGHPKREPGRSKPACAGCPLMDIEIAAQREAKRARVADEHGLELPELFGGDEFGYRWSSKRVVSGRPGRLVLGSRVASRRQRDWVADMRGCLVDHPLITAALDELEDRANALGVEPWREQAGDLRYVWAKTNGEAVALTLITGSADSQAARELGPALVEAGVVAGVAHSVQAGAGNVIRGEDTRVIAGEVELSLQLAGVEQRVGPLGFLQPNPMIAAQAYRDLVQPPDAEERGRTLACDLYAGAGVTTALLRERFLEVVPCEAYPESAAALGVEPQTAEEFCQRWIAEGRPTPELIVANPPRAGLGEAVCAGLLELAAPRVHLMSCNPATLRADLDRLAPGYALIGLQGYDTLPQTPHVEVVAWLRRR
ncbi:MAG: TRAM domain-containing protein [Enhygromyxa sp.]